MPEMDAKEQIIASGEPFRCRSPGLTEFRLSRSACAVRQTLRITELGDQNGVAPVALIVE